MKRLAVFCVFLMFIGFHAEAGKPRFVHARVVAAGDNRYHFTAQIAHFDLSWEHFVDRWEIIGENRRVLATDNIYYPQIGGGVLVRLLTGVKVEPGTEYVIFRVHDKQDGYGREKLVYLPTADKPDTDWQ